MLWQPVRSWLFPTPTTHRFILGPSLLQLGMQTYLRCYAQGRVNKLTKSVCLQDFLVCLQDHLPNYSGEMFVHLLDMSFSAVVNIVVFSSVNRVLQPPLGGTVLFDLWVLPCCVLTHDQLLCFFRAPRGGVGGSSAGPTLCGGYHALGKKQRGREVKPNRHRTFWVCSLKSFTEVPALSWHLHLPLQWSVLMYHLHKYCISVTV